MEKKEQFKEQTLEEMMEEIEQILAQLEEGGVSLEESFALYEKGMSKCRLCGEKLDGVEKKMLVINREGNLEDFS